MQGEFLQKFQRPRIDARLQELRERAKTGLDPTVPDETLNFLLALARLKNPRRILEIGAAEGLTSISLLRNVPPRALRQSSRTGRASRPRRRILPASASRTGRT